MRPSPVQHVVLQFPQRRPAGMMLFFFLLHCFSFKREGSFPPPPSFGHPGVEQLSSLQHLDLAYNLLLEHSQLAPLSLLHHLATVRRKHVVCWKTCISESLCSVLFLLTGGFIGCLFYCLPTAEPGGQPTLLPEVAPHLHCPAPLAQGRH